jgi:hypothetical protein
MRHLHRDYHTSHCGQDISHLLATFNENEATCKACQTGLEQFRKDEEAARLADEQERQVHETRLINEREERKHRLAEQERLAIEASQRQEDRLRNLEAEIARLKGEA